MSLYGPKVNLPKVNIPTPGNPSWNMEKEKKFIIAIAAIIVVIVLLYLFLPGIIQGLGEGFGGLMNPAVSVTWKNNPLDLTKGMQDSEMDILITNTQKEVQTVSFTITTSSEEIIYFCPNSIYDANKNVYVLENLAPQDKRTIPCVVRRNPNAAVFTGSYTLNINTSLGNIKTNFEVITK